MSETKDILKSSTPLHWRFELHDASTGLRKPNATGVKAKFLQNSVKIDVSGDVVEIGDGWYSVDFAPNKVGSLYFYTGADGCEDSTQFFCVHDLPYGFQDWDFNDSNKAFVSIGK